MCISTFACIVVKEQGKALLDEIFQDFLLILNILELHCTIIAMYNNYFHLSCSLLRTNSGSEKKCLEISPKLCLKKFVSEHILFPVIYSPGIFWDPSINTKVPQLLFHIYLFLWAIF